MLFITKYFYIMKFYRNITTKYNRKIKTEGWELKPLSQV